MASNPVAWGGNAWESQTSHGAPSDVNVGEHKPHKKEKL